MYIYVYICMYVCTYIHAYIYALITNATVGFLMRYIANPTVGYLTKNCYTSDYQIFNPKQLRIRVSKTMLDT